MKASKLGRYWNNKPPWPQYWSTRLVNEIIMNTLTIRTTPASSEILAKRAEAMLQVEEMCKSQVQWYQTVTVAEYRRMRAEGIGFPKPSLYEGARTVTLAGRHGHDIQLRVIQAQTTSKGVLLHFHAGAFPARVFF